MQPGTVLFFPLFDRENSLAKTCELGEFLLDGFQSFLPLAVSYLSLGAVAVLTPGTSILIIQLSNLGDLGAEIADLFAEHG
jgi:hypothetical protein